MEPKPGNTIRYEDGSVTTNFCGKLLKRTFSSVMCVDHATAVAQ